MARAKACANTFPGRVVQLEADYLGMNGIDASWLFGHCGSSDLGRSYWLLTWQFASSEDKPRATELLSTTTDLIHNKTEGRVTNFLVDGGTALAAAVENVSNRCDLENRYVYNRIFDNSNIRIYSA